MTVEICQRSSCRHMSVKRQLCMRVFPVKGLHFDRSIWTAVGLLFIKFMDLNCLPGLWIRSQSSSIKTQQDPRRLSAFCDLQILVQCKGYESVSNIETNAKLNMQIDSFKLAARALHLKFKWFERANVCTFYFLHLETVHVTLCLKDTSFIKRKSIIITAVFAQNGTINTQPRCSV